MQTETEYQAERILVLIEKATGKRSAEVKAEYDYRATQIIRDAIQYGRNMAAKDILDTSTVMMETDGVVWMQSERAAQIAEGSF